MALSEVFLISLMRKLEMTFSRFVFGWAAAHPAIANNQCL
jgi:hypothetical protein